MLSLDDVENRLRDMKDARIHFAIVCASKSCPPLRARAYTAASLSAALDEQARAFLADPAKNVLDRARGRLALSKIFDWNRKEFERDGGSIAKYASRFAPDPALASWLAAFPEGAGVPRLRLGSEPALRAYLRGPRCPARGTPSRIAR